MSAKAKSFRRTTKTVGIGLVAMGCLSVASGARAQLQQNEYRAADGTTYQVLVADNLGGGAENIRVTTVAGGLGGSGVSSCAASGDSSGQPTSAIGSVNLALHPYGNIQRTGIINGFDVSMLSFNGTYGGRLTIGAPGTQTYVCGAAFDCMGVTAQPLFNLDSASGGVPAACIANDLLADCAGLTPRDAFAFGLAASGSPPVCTTPSLTTTDSTVCATQPSDGFTLGNHQAIVFIYSSMLANSSFGVASGGFGISTDTVNNPSCPNPNSIISATSGNEVQPAPPPPTPTPTNTPTNTATATNTATNTATLTVTATNTLTPTSTVTPSNTATQTSTRTNTATVTRTSTATNTRPPIPVVPSPTSPAGLLMIIGLGGGLLWALRRMSSVR